MNHYQNHASIAQWAEEDRPREKLQLKGAAALSDAELIAILIGSGSSRESAVSLAQRLLQSVSNHLPALARLSLNELCQFHGIGEAKAIAIISALELGKRRRLAQALERKRITSSSQAFEVLQPLLGDLSHEEFWVLYLNSRNELIKAQNTSRGGISGTIADQRIVFRFALQYQATGLILAHNHPSGALKPSAADRQLTRKMVEAGRIMDVAVLDHLIITEHAFFSFSDEGEL